MFLTNWIARIKEKIVQLTFIQRIGFALFSVIALVILVSGAAYAGFQSNIVTVYQVYQNGNLIGVVDDPNVVRDWLQERKTKEEAKHNVQSFELADEITFVEEKVWQDSIDNNAVLDALSQQTEINVDAVQIEVNGNNVGYATSQSEVDRILNQLKQKYGGNEKGKKAAFQAASIDDENRTEDQVRIKENIAMKEATVPASQVLSSEELEKLLGKGTSAEKVHTVQEGDCLGCIAGKYGIPLSDLLANNPGLTENTLLQLGQEINISLSQPVITVQVTEEITEDEVINYKTETRPNRQLPKGETRVVQQGKEGTKRVQYRVTKENGKTVERKIISEQVLTQPVTRIVDHGTKVLTSRGTGRMTWPARGVLTSSYGERWGKLHKGLDIAGSGSIKATDNGRVVLAGWYGSYGNAVIIDHGNGVQTLYGHMKSIRVGEGERVTKGTIIGIMGSTGNSTGVHVHFEVKKNGTIQNPMKYLKK